MTAPNTPPGPDAEPPPEGDPYAPSEPPEQRAPRRLLPEFRVGGLSGLACVVLGVVMGLLWLWLAPRVMYVVKGDQVLYVNPEGEERAGQDGIFALLGLGAGLLTALAAFLLTRRRGGGIAVAAGLALGGLGGSLLALGIGYWLGPTSDVLAHAKQAGEGHPFSDALKLGSEGALLVWPITAMVVLLALTAAFGVREPDQPPYWAGSQWGPDAAPAEHPNGPDPQA